MQCFAFPEERHPLELQHLPESKPEVVHPLAAILLLCDVCALFSLACALHLNQDHVFGLTGALAPRLRVRDSELGVREERRGVLHPGLVDRLTVVVERVRQDEVPCQMGRCRSFPGQLLYMEPQQGS